MDQQQQQMSPDQWRFETTVRLAVHDEKLDKLHACIEEKVDRLTIAITAIGTRVDPLERLQAMVAGGLAVLVVVVPLVWYLLSRIKP